MNLVGYDPSVFDNGDYFYGDAFQFSSICRACGWHTNFQEHNSAYRQRRKRRSALLRTYDGAYIISKSFKLFCEAEKYDGIECLPFDQDPEHFHLVLHNKVEIDQVSSRVEMVDNCPICNNATSVSGALPAYLVRREPLIDGIWRSNLFFGDGDYKFPIIIVGLETPKKMKAVGLKGLVFKDVYSIH